MWLCATCKMLWRSKCHKCRPFSKCFLNRLVLPFVIAFDQVTEQSCFQQLCLFSVLFHLSVDTSQHCDKLQSAPVSCLSWDTLITIDIKTTSVKAFPVWPWDRLKHTHTNTHFNVQEIITWKTHRSLESFK